MAIQPHRRVSPELAALRLAKSRMPAEDLRLLLQVAKREKAQAKPRRRKL